MDNSVPEAFIFMKVGPHGGECLEQILKRKQREFEKERMIFWSYGEKGPLHPTKQVQPFVERWIKELGSVEVLMEEIKTRRQSGPPAGTAKSYSVENNKEGTESIPKGIKTGTGHALVLAEIRKEPFDLDLRGYKVGIGDKCGRNAAEYLAFRGMKEQTGRPRGADKACLVKAGSSYDGPSASKAKVHIKYRATLLCPNAVFTFPDCA